MEVPPNEDSELPASADAVHQEQDDVLPVPDTINDGYISIQFISCNIYFLVMMFGFDLVFL